MPTTQVSTTSLVSLAEAKVWLKLDTDTENRLIETLISAATELVETETRQSFSVSTYETSFDSFPTPAIFGGVDPIMLPFETDLLTSSSLVLPMFPVTAVSEIEYVDSNGATQTLSASVYGVDLKGKPSRVYLKAGQSWPATQAIPNAVTVTYSVGYPTGETYPSAPARAKQAILYLVATWYENRESVVVGSISVEMQNSYKKLIWSLKFPSFA